MCAADFTVAGRLLVCPLHPPRRLVLQRLSAAPT